MIKLEKIDISLKNKHGIYQIKNNKNEKVYIGSAVDLYGRLHTHINSLKHNKHYNKHLQKSWCKYGEESFDLYIVEFLNDKSMLIKREQFWIDSTDCTNINNGYNILPNAGSPLGTKLSEETRKKIGNALRGKKLSRDTVRKIQESREKSGYKNFSIMKRVVQLDSVGQLVKIWESISETESSGFDSSTVWHCCNKLYDAHRGFFFFYYDDYISEGFEFKIKVNKNKPILQISKHGEIIKLWNSISEISNSEMFDRNCVMACCKNLSQSHRGYIWIFNEEYDSKYFDPKKYKIIEVNKGIVQLSLNGEFLREWDNTVEIKNYLNINGSHILDCCKGIKKTCKNFIWVYREDYYNEFYKLITVRFKEKIYQYLLDGTLIRIWNTPKQITDTLGFNNRPITLTCKNKNGVAYGYIWVYESDILELNNSNRFNPQNYKPIKKIQRCAKENDKLIVIDEWDSIMSASKVLNVNRNGITRCCKKEIDSYQGYYWRYAL